MSAPSQSQADRIDSAKEAFFDNHFQRLTDKGHKLKISIYINDVAYARNKYVTPAQAFACTENHFNYFSEATSEVSGPNMQPKSKTSAPNQQHRGRFGNGPDGDPDDPSSDSDDSNTDDDEILCPDPSDKSKRMQSPVHKYGMNHILRQEMLDNIARHNGNRFVVSIGMDTSVFNTQARPNGPGTFLQPKVSFPMSKKNQYPFESVSFPAYRKILTDIVSHYLKGETNADFNFSLYDCLKSAFLRSMLTKWRAQVNAACRETRS